MICPNCKKPYLFIDKSDSVLSKCLKCGYSEKFKQPEYLNYHKNLYTKKRYTRNTKTDPQMKEIMRSLNIRPEDKVLDIGCGVGDYTKEISGLSQFTFGLDLNVEVAKNKYPGINFLNHNCNTSLPFDNNSIDKIVSINLIEHLVDHEKFLSECRRVLKSEGKIALTTANLDFFLHDYFFDKTHVHEWSLSEFRNIVSAHFSTDVLKKSSSMFNYYPFNLIATRILKPDILFIGTKK